MTSISAATEQNNARYLYNGQLNDPRWHQLRMQILSRDGQRCKHCRSTQDLQVHHRQYHVLADGQWLAPWQYHPHFLITLCRPCHEEGHKMFKIPKFQIPNPKPKNQNNNKQ